MLQSVHDDNTISAQPTGKVVINMLDLSLAIPHSLLSSSAKDIESEYEDNKNCGTHESLNYNYNIMSFTIDNISYDINLFALDIAFI